MKTQNFDILYSLNVTTLSPTCLIVQQNSNLNNGPNNLYTISHELRYSEERNKPNNKIDLLKLQKRGNN